MAELEYDVLKEEFVPVTKVKEMLKDIEEKTFEQKIAFEHSKKFAKIAPAKADELFKELSSLEMRKLKDDQIVKIIDIMPEDVDGLKVILAHSQVPFKDEEFTQVLEIVKKYEK
jgi:DNA-directed RNA polymerase subunit F